EAVRGQLPELPDAKKQRFMHDYGLSAYDAGVLTAERDVADYYEAVVRELGAEPKLAANWVMVELAARLNEHNLAIALCPVSAAALAGMLRRIVDNTISGKIAKDVFEAM